MTPGELRPPRMDPLALARPLPRPVGPTRRRAAEELPEAGAGAQAQAKKLVLPLLAAALALAPAAPAAAQAPPPDPARIVHALRPAVRLAGRADTTFELADRMGHYHVPGVSIAVVDSLRVVWAGGFGVQQFGGTEPVDTSTLFLAGSISKPVFATGALALVDQGKLALDRDINADLRSWHLPESRFTAERKVTLRRLLTHSAGLTVWGFPGYEAGKPVPTVPQLLDGAPPANTRAVRNDTVPGARWLYSGGGITIAQLAATDVTGETFPALMRRLVLGPAGMVHSTYENPPPAEKLPFVASGHEKPDTPVPGRFHVYPEMAAAGLWTTASDLARWAIAVSDSYLGRPGGVLPPATAREMLRPQVAVGAPYASLLSPSWGLGVGVGGAGDSLRFTHGGRDEGFVAYFVMWPEKGRGLFVLTNGVSNGLLNEITRAFDAEYGLVDAPRVEKRLAAAPPAAVLDRLAGAYRAIVDGDTIVFRVRRTAAGLRAGAAGAIPERALLPQSADSFFDMENGADWTFEGAAAGSPRALRFTQGTRTITADRCSASCQEARP
ncbi:MAG TPA: serine hydrolase domain-containing protein [Longimicrobiales bacterium]|nr:serine hydrolase domain-containing protein [Longimicrobiales bacterium]